MECFSLSFISISLSTSLSQTPPGTAQSGSAKNIPPSWDEHVENHGSLTTNKGSSTCTGKEPGSFVTFQLIQPGPSHPGWPTSAISTWWETLVFPKKTQTQAQLFGLCHKQTTDPGNTFSERQTCVHYHTLTFSFQSLSRCSKERQSQYQHQFVHVPKSVSGITYENSGECLINKVAFGQVTPYELVGLLRETMSVIRPTKKV